MEGQETGLPKMEIGTPRKAGLQGQALQARRWGGTPSRSDGLCLADRMPSGKGQLVNSRRCSRKRAGATIFKTLEDKFGSSKLRLANSGGS